MELWESIVWLEGYIERTNSYWDNWIGIIKQIFSGKKGGVSSYAVRGEHAFDSYAMAGD